jgi:glycosyltransferase involved in cell wall biosynthesis
MITAIVPAHDEMLYLEKYVKLVEESIVEHDDYEIIIAEDGSSDGTEAVASRIASSNDRIRHLHSDDRLGRGKALIEAIRAARGDVILFCDADMATHPQAFEDLSQLARLRSGKK